MPSIQAGTDPNIPYPKHTFWFWESINIIVPLVGILFLDWHIFTLVLIFWWEIACWGAVGVLKMLSANAATNFVEWTLGRLFYAGAFAVLYGGLFLILLSFTFIRFSSEDMLSTDSGVRISLIVIGINYLVEYIRSEIVTGRFRTRFPMEIIFERMVYALPLAALVLFAVLPLSEKFDGATAQKVIGIGIVLAKFIMDTVLHYAPGLLLDLQANTVEGETENGAEG